ncbi:MAG: hypothetical protein Q8Q09_27765 [Deltaproteobacteria bacterium]|nr:hypothetical protein [Deltaproteobacteria bacterium]
MTRNLHTLLFASLSCLVACGGGPVNNTDGGADGDAGMTLSRVTGSFTTISSGTTSELRGIWGISPTDLYAVGTQTLRRYNGMSWAGDGRTETFAAVSGSAAVGAVAVGGEMGMSGGSDMGRGVIVQRLGTSWTSRMVAMTTPQLQGVFVAGMDLFAVGNGLILRAPNNGTWAPSMTPEAAGDLYALHGTGPSDVWAVGEKVWHWDGTAWTRSNTGSTSYALAVSAIAPNDVWIVGVSGSARRWDGTMWVNFPTGINESLYGIWSRAGNDVWAVGERGAVVHFNGAMWERVMSGTTQTLRAVHGFADTGQLFAVGENGTAVTYTP